jgi:hypothetical protein
MPPTSPRASDSSALPDRALDRVVPQASHENCSPLAWSQRRKARDYGATPNQTLTGQILRLIEDYARHRPLDILLNVLVG